MNQFHAPHPWKVIQEKAGKQKAMVAVPFIGKNASKLLPIPSGSILVTRFTDMAIKAGQVSPQEIIQFLKRGVKVHNYPNLHSKVYVFGRRVFVGSANVSSSSMSLSEACIETTDSEIIQSAKNYIETLCSDLVTLEEAKSKLSLYPKDGERMFGVKSSNEKDKSHYSVWVFPLEEASYNEEEQKAWDTGFDIANKKITNPKISKLEGAITHHGKYQLGDWVVQRFNYKSGFLFECPAKIIHMEAIKNSNKICVYLDQPKWARDIPSAKVREVLGNDATVVLYKADSNRKIRSNPTARALLTMWKHHQGMIE
jgi:hypothetical protein